ncbi:FAD/NAD(P)-binding protein [Sphingosinicella sp.]|uniref:FAD/NAD(P)-binding protein n=1 Tax=Sphingosinicella sp. TaxID=1917971 RepID=UPI004038452D
MSHAHVAVVGAGLSGALQAIHLVHAGAGKVSLIERSRVPGRGVAYGTDRPEHLLNVPARRMSAYPDRPDHFTDWWSARGGDEEGYAPRMVYGDYVRAQLAEAMHGIEIVSGEAVDISSIAGGEEVRLSDGRTIAADAVVLAPGNLEPAVPGRFDVAALGAAWIGDPWAADLGEGLGADATIVILGTGLTAVDTALTLDARGFTGRMLALSRRGLSPRAHEPREPMVAPQEQLPTSCAGLTRRLRRRSAEVGWRSAVHELRSVTQGLWRDASAVERGRFLRHLRPWWDVHRHRIAPAVGATIARLEREGRLAFVPGKIVAVEPAGTGARLIWRPRGSDRVETVEAARIVNCTGPEMNIVRAGEPLFDALIAAGRIRPDPLRIGLDVDWDCRVLGGDGAPSATLSAIGPVTRGTFWESVAVPDIRVQAERVAKRLAG